MLTLVTAPPGGGKTAYIITTLKEEKTRKIYYHNIPGLTLDWIPLENPAEWHKEVEDGSIVVIDEVQEVFPTRSPKAPVPEGITALERHRHRGIDLYFATQHPTMLDHHARRLVNLHLMLRRNFNRGTTYVYSNNDVMDPQDARTFSKADKKPFSFTANKSSFDLYRSTVADTHAFKMPRRAWIGIGSIFVFIALAIYAYYAIFIDTPTTAPDPTNTVNYQPGQPTGNYQPYADNSVQSLSDTISPVDGFPWLAPAYIAANTEPEIPEIAGCVLSGFRCTCYSQQATRYHFSYQSCVDYIQNGRYNPYRSKDTQQDDKERGSNFEGGITAYSELVETKDRLQTPKLDIIK